MKRVFVVALPCVILGGHAEAVNTRPAPPVTQFTQKDIQNVSPAGLIVEVSTCVREKTKTRISEIIRSPLHAIMAAALAPRDASGSSRVICGRIAVRLRPVPEAAPTPSATILSTQIRSAGNPI